MVAPSMRRKPLNLTKRTTRKLSYVQAYSRLYYKKKLKDIVAALWERHITRHPELKNKKGQVLKHRNAVIRELLNAETDEVKAEVRRRREEGDYSDDEDINPDDDNAVDAVEIQRRTRAYGFQRKVILHF
jgi:hypothetical protein